MEYKCIALPWAFFSKYRLTDRLSTDFAEEVSVQVFLLDFRLCLLCKLTYFSSCWMQAFARLSAVYGGTYMLAKPDCKVKVLVNYVLISHIYNQTR